MKIEPEYVLVPRKAIDWLFGAGPDNDGYHFGDELAPRGRGNFWWRSKFREMIPALSARPDDSAVERVQKVLQPAWDNIRSLPPIDFTPDERRALAIGIIAALGGSGPCA